MKKNLFLFLLLTCFGQLLSDNPVLFSEKDKLINISSHIQYLEDKQNSFSVESIINKEFTLTKSQVPNLGFSNSFFWIKIPITNNSNTNDLLLELSLPILDYMEFYSPKVNSEFEIIKTGEEFPFYFRKYQDPNFLFDITIPKGETKTFYLKIRSNDAIQLPIKIGTQSAIYSQIKNRDILSGIYAGIMLVMLLYNLFIYFSTKDKSYIYYVIYVLLVLLTQTCLEGYPFQYLWPSYPVIAKYSLFVFPSLVGISSMIFMNVFLKVNHFYPKLFKLSFIFSFIYTLPILLAFLQIFDVSQKIMEISAGIVSIYMLITAILINKKGYSPAKYFLVAWVTFLVGVIIFILKDLDILPYNNFTRYTMQIGSAIETVLLSFALADRINILRKENDRIIKEQNAILETKVNERTAELIATNKSLKEAESNLINAEKMASLGQLTAGISHEINNPINFVVSNVKPLKRDVKEILLILSKYLEITDGKNFDEKKKELTELQNKLDVNYLTEEINLLLQGIDEGANRTAEIIKGLKNFSRANEAEIKKANIHEGIDATLSLLNSNIQAKKIQIIKNYGQLPLIDCYPGKLNQVFMNLLNNAIQAIGSLNDLEKPQSITIETKALEKNIVIKITDTGKGIPKANLYKIFEPFFTTKDVGEGTGLGLSIVYGIIKFHEGDVKVESEDGVGSSFIITLPIQLDKKENG